MNLYIVGAGFTKAVLPDAPLNNELVNALADRSTHSAAARLRALYETNDIEIALTKLDVDIAVAASSSSRNSMRKLRFRTEVELGNYFSSITATQEVMTRSPWLTEFIAHCFARPDVAISLNYDCVLEGALDLCGKWSPNGGYGSSFDNPLVRGGQFKRSPVTVLKIHGSASFGIAPYMDKPSAQAVNFSFDEWFFPRSASNTHFGYGAGKGRTYVIAPSYVKIPAVEITYLMLDALKASSKATNLIVIGCGMRPEDTFLTVIVTNFLRHPPWRGRRIVVVDPRAKRIAKRLTSYWGVNVAKQIV